MLMFHRQYYFWTVLPKEDIKIFLFCTKVIKSWSSHTNNLQLHSEMDFLPQFEHNEYQRLLISQKIYKPAVHKGTNCKIKLSGLLLAITFVTLSNNVEKEYNNEVILYIYVAYLPQIISTESIQLSAHTTLLLQF